MDPRIVLVSTAAPAEGRGHISRAMALAEALVARDASVSMIVLRGSPTEGQRTALDALGVDIELGSPRTLRRSDLVVVDLPDPDEVAPSLRPDRLVAFDDREILRSRAAIVVQPSMPTWHGVAPAERVLAGYAWTPVRSSIREAAAHRGTVAGAGVVVCFGGSDPADVTARLAPAVADALRAAAAGSEAFDGDTTVIVGAGYRGALVDGDAWTFLRDPADIDRRLAAARLALIGAGTMKFELAALGVPTLLVAVADDQHPTGSPFAATGAARYLGDGRVIDPSVVVAAVRALAGDPGALAAMATAGPEAVDGRGANRLAAEILALGTAD